MTDNKTEMSLDEVLSSIKKMVVDEEPPVLELTDMVSEDGKIVNLRKPTGPEKKNDMSSFLQLIQENSDKKSDSEPVSLQAKEQVSPQVKEQAPLRLDNPTSAAPSRQRKDGSQRNLLIDIVQASLRPILKQWLEENLRNIVTELVKEEINKALYNSNPKE